MWGVLCVGVVGASSKQQLDAQQRQRSARATHERRALPLSKSLLNTGDLTRQDSPAYNKPITIAAAAVEALVFSCKQKNLFFFAS
jgi:hypothetical protein